MVTRRVDKAESEWEEKTTSFAQHKRLACTSLTTASFSSPKTGMAAKFMTDGEHRESRNGRETKAVQVYRTILAMETALEAYCYGGATFWVYFLFVIE